VKAATFQNIDEVLLRLLKGRRSETLTSDSPRLHGRS